MINIKLDKTGGLTGKRWLWPGRRNGRNLNGCWAVCSAPRAGSPPRSLWRRWRASLTSTARHGWRWTLSRRCGSAPACFIFKPSSAARIGHRRQVTLRCLVGGDRRELGGDAGSPISGAPAAKGARHCRSPRLPTSGREKASASQRPASGPWPGDLRYRPADRGKETTHAG